MPSSNIGTWLACRQAPLIWCANLSRGASESPDRQLIFAWTWIRVLNVVVVAAGSDASS